MAADQIVVLLHGLGRFGSSMWYMSRQLNQRGFATLNFSYRSLTRELDAHVNSLKDRLDSAGNRFEKIHFVSHSMGSIVVRKFALNFSNDYELGRAVMLGPPNQGSALARKLGQLPLADSILGPGFQEIKDLNLEPATDLLEIGVIAGGKGENSGFLPFIPGDNDGIVSVEETRLEGSKDFLVVNWVHTYLMYCPRVIEETVAFLKTGQFSSGT